MKKLLMLLIVLVLSLPAYANDANDYDILVYKTTMTGPRFAADGIKKAKVRGYLILEVDADEISNLDNGEGVGVQGRHILYVKAGRKKWRYTSQAEGSMIYFQPGKKKGTMFLLGGGDSYWLGTHEGWMDSAAYGRVRRIFIGTGRPKPRIPTKLKGHTKVARDWRGSCRQTIKLASKRTKRANKENKTVAEVVEELDNRLDRKGYELHPPL